MGPLTQSQQLARNKTLARALENFIAKALPLPKNGRAFAATPAPVIPDFVGAYIHFQFSLFGITRGRPPKITLYKDSLFYEVKSGGTQTVTLGSDRQQPKRMIDVLSTSPLAKANLRDRPLLVYIGPSDLTVGQDVFNYGAMKGVTVIKKTIFIRTLRDEGGILCDYELIYGKYRGKLE